MATQIKTIRIIFVYKFADISDEKNSRFFSRNSFFLAYLGALLPQAFQLQKKPGKSSQIHYDAMRFAPRGRLQFAASLSEGYDVIPYAPLADGDKWKIKGESSSSRPCPSGQQPRE